MTFEMVENLRIYNCILEKKEVTINKLPCIFAIKLNKEVNSAQKMKF